MTARLKVRPDGLEARVPAGMRKLRRAPRPGEKSRNLGVPKSEGRSSSSRTPSPISAAPRPRPLTLAAGARTRAGSQARGAELSEEPTPQKAGAGPGLRACPRGRVGPPASPPRVSRQPRSAPTALRQPCATDAPARPAHSRGRPLPRAVLSLWMPSGHKAFKIQHPWCAILGAHIPLLRARGPWSPALPGIRAEPATVARTCRCALAEPGTDGIC